MILLEDLRICKPQFSPFRKCCLKGKKIIVKGKLIKDDQSVQKLKKGAKIMLTGSAEAVPTGPSKKVIFIEDMPESQQKAIGGTSSAGLNNLGNTCYMNSTLQCLRHLPELRVALNRFQGNGTPEHSLLASLGKLFRDLDDSVAPVTPFLFVQLLRRIFPQFDEQDEKGGHKQQDSDECLSSILTAGARHLTQVDKDKLLPTDTATNMIDYLFGGEFALTTTCDESEAESPRSATEPFRKLKCFLDSSVNYLFQGIEKGMEEKLELTAELLGRRAQWTRKRAIKRLPRVLVVHFIRFSWGTKRREGFAVKDARAQKVLRRVQYPEVLDISPACDTDLKASFSYARGRLKDAKDKELGLTLLKEKKEDGKKTKRKKAKKRKTEDGGKDGEGDVEMGTGGSAKKATPSPSSGNYELFGVITHKGRAADGGHYIGWARQKGDSWWCYDDSKVTAVTTKDVLALCGGGDWHTAYVCLYRRVDDLEDKPASWWDKSQETTEAKAGKQ